MRNIILTISVFICSQFFTTSIYSQGCFPDPTFLSEPTGIYPLGPMLMDCSGENANATIVGATDTSSFAPPGLGNITVWFDGMRIDTIHGLPNGLTLETDVMNSANQNAPYGSWLFSGALPNLNPAIGCVNIAGLPSAWAAASTGGPNGNGEFSLTFIISYRVAATQPDISFLIPSGTWADETGGLMSFDTIEVSLHVNESGCGGSLFAFPEVTADNDQTSNCDGGVTVEVYNGVPPYTYSFSSGTTGTPTDTALCPGQYSVSITDANGTSTTTEFIISSTANVYTNVGNNGWPPVGADSLFSLFYTCDLDYSLPIDSFYITGAVTAGPDTCLVDWVIWQAGQPYSATTIYPFLGLTPTVFSLVLWCESGRSELGSFQIYEFLDLSVGIEENQAVLRAEVYPNPSNGLFNLQLDNTETVQVRIMDVSGKLLQSQQLSGSTIYTLDMQTAPAGLYLLELETENGKAYKRLIKN